MPTASSDFLPVAFMPSGMSPYETISYICSRSPSTVGRWFRTGKNYHAPQPSDLCHLALMDFILEHFEEIPPEWFRLLCSDDRDRDKTGA